MHDIHNQFRTRYRDVLQKPDGSILQLGEVIQVRNNSGHPGWNLKDTPGMMELKYDRLPNEADRDSTFYRGRFLFRTMSYPVSTRAYRAEELGPDWKHLRLTYRDYSPWRSSALSHSTGKQQVRHRHPNQYGKRPYTVTL